MPKILPDSHFKLNLASAAVLKLLKQHSLANFTTMGDHVADPSVGLLAGVGLLIVCVIIALTCHLCCDKSDDEAIWFEGSRHTIQMSGVDPEEAAMLGHDAA